MAKEKDTITPKGRDVAETGPAEKSAPVSRVQSEDDALLLLIGFDIPKDMQEVFVTEDCNVFWKENESFARNHASKQGLKLFTIKCQDLVR